MGMQEECENDPAHKDKTQPGDGQYIWRVRNTDFGYSKFFPTNMALGPFVAPRVPFDAALQDLSIEASNTQNFQKMTLFRALQWIS